MKTYILYHGNCPDGTGAALAAYLRFGEATESGPVEYIPVNYGKPIPAVELGSDVYIVDFSYPRAQLEGLKASCPDLVVLDHHATAEKDLVGLPYCTFDMNKSGAVLAWEHFHPGKSVPLFILYLQDRDLWRFALPQSREVSAAIGSYPMDFRIWANWLRDDKDTIIEALAGEGVTCLRLKNQQVDLMCRHSRWAVFSMKPYTTSPSVTFSDHMDTTGMSGVEIGIISAPVANATVFFSEVGERLLELNPDAPFSAYYMDRNDGKRQWGLRSRPDFDCSVIAKAMGGGGHKQASGFVQDL